MKSSISWSAVWRFTTRKRQCCVTGLRRGCLGDSAAQHVCNFALHRETVCCEFGEDQASVQCDLESTAA